MSLNAMQELAERMMNDATTLSSPELGFMRTLALRASEVSYACDAHAQRYQRLWDTVQCMTQLSLEDGAEHWLAFASQFTMPERRHNLRLRAALVLAFQAWTIHVENEPRLTESTEALMNELDVMLCGRSTAPTDDAQGLVDAIDDDNCLVINRVGQYVVCYEGESKPYFGTQYYVKQNEAPFKPTPPGKQVPFDVHGWAEMQGTIAPEDTLPPALQLALRGCLGKTGHQLLLYLADLLQHDSNSNITIHMGCRGPYVDAGDVSLLVLVHPTQLFRHYGSETYYDPREDTCKLLPLNTQCRCSMQLLAPPVEVENDKSVYTAQQVLSAPKTFRSKAVRLRGGQDRVFTHYSTRVFKEMLRGYAPSVAVSADQPYYKLVRTTDAAPHVLDDPQPAAVETAMRGADAQWDKLFDPAMRVRGVPVAIKSQSSAAKRDWWRRRLHFSTPSPNKARAAYCVCPYEVASFEQLVTSPFDKAGLVEHRVTKPMADLMLHPREVLQSHGDHGLMTALALTSPGHVLEVFHASAMTLQTDGEPRSTYLQATQLANRMATLVHCSIPLQMQAIVQGIIEGGDPQAALEHVKRMYQPAQAVSTGLQLSAALNVDIAAMQHVQPDELPEAEAEWVTHALDSVDLLPGVQDSLIDDWQLQHLELDLMEMLEEDDK